MDNISKPSELAFLARPNMSISENCVHDLFVKQAILNPKKIAVKFNESSITYYDLNKKSDYLASILREKNLGSNPKIGIAIDRSIDLIIAVLGILKTGGACVPLDISYPNNRLEFMAKDSGINIVLTSKNVTVVHPNIKSLSEGRLLIYLDLIDYGEMTAEYKIQQDYSHLDNLIYVLYTSGSTGQPKGVSMPHRALSNLIIWHLMNFDLEKPSITLQYSPISFDVSFQEIFSTLCAGQLLVLITEEARKNPEALFETLRAENISRIFLPVVALQQLAEVAKNRETLQSLKTVITAGEQLKITPDIELFFAGIPEASLYNHYGPTETHVVTSYKLSKQNKKWPILPPIGFPISNVEIYILDEEGKSVVRGSTGELYLGGACLAKGYHNLPELTNERFISNPFGEGVLYKTGDLVCVQSDGAINYLGRIDRQVKIRGFRIELSEIEVILLQHNNIKECVVIDYEFEVGHKTLVAYLVLDAEFENKLNIVRRDDFGFKIVPRTLFSELQYHLNQILPSYMLPSSYIIVRNIPLTPTGKVDRAALPVPPALNINALIKDIRSNQGSLAEKITIIWEQLLQIKPIDINENFFDLGGYSLLLVTLHKILTEVLDYQFPIIVLYENPTISKLVSYFSKDHNNIIYCENRETLGKRNLNSKMLNQRKNLRKKVQIRNHIDEKYS